MSIQKIVLIVIGATLGLCILITCCISSVVGIAFFSTKDLVHSGDTFLVLLKDNKVDEAYNNTSIEFQKNTSAIEFHDYVSSNNLDKNQGVFFWTNREISGNNGHLNGLLRIGTKNYDCSIDLILEQGSWKVNAMTIK